MLKGWLVGMAQSTRISGYDTVEAYTSDRLEKGEWDLAGIGSGIENAVRAIHPDTWGRRSFEIPFPDPFTVNADTAWEAECVALKCAEDGKKMGLMARLIGGQLVASIYGLRALADAKSRSVAARARAAYPTKLELAKRAFEAYSDESAEMYRNLQEDPTMRG